MRKKEVILKNYLEMKPKRAEGILWTSNEAGDVTIEIENKGMVNRLAQLIFSKPKTSFVHLDKTGSFIWNLLDGEKTIKEIGKSVEKNFGDSVKPLYERLSKYIQILESYNFISYKKD